MITIEQVGSETHGVEGKELKVVLMVTAKDHDYLQRKLRASGFTADGESWTTSVSVTDAVLTIFRNNLGGKGYPYTIRLAINYSGPGNDLELIYLGDAKVMLPGEVEVEYAFRVRVTITPND